MMELYAEEWTDVHTHLLPSIDDGCSTEGECLEILSFLQTQGVCRLFFTPHVRADYVRNTASDLKKKIARFRQKETAIPQGMQIRLAAEYMLDECFYPRLEEGLLSYDGQHVLAELPEFYVSLGYREQLYQMQLNGYIPVLAHPERYAFFSQREYEDLKERGCKFQLNLFSLAGFYGSGVRSTARWLLKEGLYDFAGSDIHSSAYEEWYRNGKLKRAERAGVERLIKNNESLWTL